MKCPSRTASVSTVYSRQLTSWCSLISRSVSVFILQLASWRGGRFTLRKLEGASCLSGVNRNARPKFCHLCSMVCVWWAACLTVVSFIDWHVYWFYDCLPKKLSNKESNRRGKQFNHMSNLLKDKKKKKHVLSTTVQILDVITSFNSNCYPVMVYRRKKIMK
jgi:hypothetical protein